MSSISGRTRWDAADPQAWASTLGLVAMPLFSPNQRSSQNTRNDSYQLLLNGQKTSFLFHAPPRGEPFARDLPSWSWSSNVRHTVIVDRLQQELRLQRWDSPSTFRTFKLPNHSDAAAELMDVLNNAPPLMVEDVIFFVLRAFRILRERIPNNDPLLSIKALNALLVGTEKARLQNKEDDWHNLQTLHDVMEFITKEQCNAVGIVDFPNPDGIQVSELINFLIQPAPGSECRLEPNLLLRHAAGQLYQEAHILIERERHRQGSFAFAAGVEPTRGVPSSSDIHFTPVCLASVVRPICS